MKIHQLPEGARFEYEGEEYVKTGPMFATGKRGQRLIPKYAVLKPLGTVDTAPTKAKNDLLPRAAVRAAFDAFYTECARHVPDDRRPAVEAAREPFLQAID